MTRKAKDYSKTLIYKIVCKDTNINDMYIGHTTNWVNRKSLHKMTSINNKYKGYNQFKYEFIRNNGNWENWNMILIEKYPCDNQLEAEKRERYWIDELKPTLNKVRPIITNQERKIKNQEYHNVNKNIIYNKNKEYRDNNKDKLNERSKTYQKTKGIEIIECEICKAKITRNSLSRHKKTKKCLETESN